MSALKKDDTEDVVENGELEFDVGNDWRKDADATKTTIFKEDDMELSEDDLDISSLSLDLGGEAAKASAAKHAKEQVSKTKKLRLRKNQESDTLKNLQEAAAGEAVDDDSEEMEILTEEDKALVNDPIFTNKDNLYPQIHGNYFLLDHLVDGGMAKVCRARYLGEGDEADKMVAIKMVQEKFSEDEDFVQMFIDEIKVSFGLNHPNINTTFDYGKIGKNLFVSMEYIHGKDLMVVIDELKEQGKTIPIPMAIFIASKMCEALHYAHNFTNKLTGQKYNIVHRDISPHNAMVSYEGYVKVIDFGIAKADTNSQKEEEGTVKGKINYFAPEYLEGKKIDHRYDQFAVALTLWEMLTGEKTFTGADQLSTLKTILACQPAKASIKNKEVPKELDKIVMKALSRDPANRYKDMQAFNKQLMKTLYQLYPDFHESDIAELMTTLFKESYEKDLEKFKGFGKYSITDIVAKIKAFKEFQKRQKEKAAEKGGKAKEVVFDFGFEEESVSVRSSKKGVDALAGNRKNKKKGKSAGPGVTARKSQRKQQKALAAILKEDDDYVKPRSPLEEHRSLLFLLLIVGIGYFQKEAIMGLLKSKPVQRAQVVEEIVDPKSGLDKSTSNFLNKLKNKDTQEKNEPKGSPLKKVRRTRRARKSNDLQNTPVGNLPAQGKIKVVTPTQQARQVEKAKVSIDQGTEPISGNVENEPIVNEELANQTQGNQEFLKRIKNNDSKVAENPSVEGEPQSVKVDSSGAETVKEESQEVSAEVPQDEVPVEEELNDTQAELAKLKAEMNALLNEKEPSEEEKRKRELKKKAQAARLKREMASKLDQLEEKEEPTVIEPRQEEGKDESGVMKFIKSRKALKWMFE